MLKVLNTYLKTHNIFVHYFIYYKYNLVTCSSKLKTRQYTKILKVLNDLII